MISRWLTVLLSCAFVCAAQDLDHQFLTQVKPLLESRCVSCHGPDKVKGGLRLDSREAAVKGGDSGPAVMPGKPDESLLLQAVLHSKKELEMPPKEKLTSREISLLERWIANGAPWPKGSAAAEMPPLAAGEKIGDAWHDPRNPIVRIFGGQRLNLWSLKEVRRPSVPAVKHGAWVRNPIDAFVLARLEQEGVEPQIEANRRTLIRRLSFDLTGLPPSPEAVDEFLRDDAPHAYERLVDKLLDSPRYGEHAARQWLDVIRYSDSNGFDWDEFRPKAWRFRDYVIRSFNADKPFDQFVREQLAGDEMVQGAPRDSKEQDCLIATGYLRLGPHDNSAAAFNEQARSRAELMADLVETTSSAFLGMTMACCRCHDHKYDPLSQADHFRMRAFFEGVKFADDLPLDLADRQKAIREHNEAVDERIKPIRVERDRIQGAAKQRLREQLVAKLSPEEATLLKMGPEQPTDEQKHRILELEKKVTPGEKEITAAYCDEEKKQVEDLNKTIEALKKEKQEFTLGLLMTDAEGEPPPTKILYQGDYKTERGAVQPGFISALDPNPARIASGANKKTLGRRLTLATWIASTNNPLAARVFVNRVWQTHFGVGLVGTANDFGLAGAPPSHPELLDWLATEFVREGWSVKQLHRLIVTSATYRQASSPASAESPTLIRIGARRTKAKEKTIDSENRFLGRQNLKRLTAEQLRDSILSVSGQLKTSCGGPPVWPALPSEILVANPAFLDDNAEKTKGWYPSAAQDQNVRSIFLVQKRTVRVPFLETFDLPENATSCPRRSESTVAPQALSLLNSPLSIEAAKAFADRTVKEAGKEPGAQVRRAFLLAYQRPPTAGELRECVGFLQRHSLPELCRALLNGNEFVYAD